MNLLLFTRFLVSTTETGLAFLKFPAQLRKSSSLAVACLFRPGETANRCGLIDTVARRHMEKRFDAQRGESRFVFSTRTGQQANGDSPEWNARSSPQLLRSPGMSIAS